MSISLLDDPVTFWSIVTLWPLAIALGAKLIERRAARRQALVPAVAAARMCIDTFMAGRALPIPQRRDHPLLHAVMRTLGEARPASDADRNDLAARLEADATAALGHEGDRSLVAWAQACTFGAPLFGLGGTLWGLVSAFNRLPDGGGISALGPDMAVALGTTVAGLVPSLVVGVLVAGTRLVHHLDDELDAIDRVVERLLDRHSGRVEDAPSTTGASPHVMGTTSRRPDPERAAGGARHATT